MGGLRVGGIILASLQRYHDNFHDEEREEKKKKIDIKRRKIKGLGKVYR